jgi:hypothetical protein
MEPCCTFLLLKDFALESQHHYVLTGITPESRINCKTGIADFETV